MYLSGLIHRERLFDIACRWLADRVAPTDGRTLTEIFVFERAITAPSVRALVADLSREHRPGSLSLRRVTTKDAVRDAIVAAVTDPSPRAAGLLDRYRAQPEEFFPRTPVHMSLITRDHGRLVAMVRRKRIRRIADKVSRQVAEQLAGEIGDAARYLAAERARSAGVPLQQMVVDSTEMDEDFTAAERMVADRIRIGELTLDPDRQQVDDLIGVKLVLEPQPRSHASRSALDRRDGTWTFHRTVHEGSYVRHPLPGGARAAAGGRHRRRPAQTSTGRSPPAGACRSSTSRTSVYEFVSTGSRSVRVELILTTMDDLVESEFGRSIHEVRILEQRDRASYSGRIALERVLDHRVHAPPRDLTDRDGRRAADQDLGALPARHPVSRHRHAQQR